MSRPLGAVALLLVAALAGCTAPPPAPAPQEEAPPVQAGLVATQDVANISQPEEQSDFARSLDEKFHTHNYWGSSLEKLLMDQEVASEPIVADPQEFGPFGAVFVTVFRLGFFGGAGWARFELPEGSIVPPESERIEATVTWVDRPTITGLRLGWQHAGNRDINVSEALPDGGGTIVIPTALVENDMPHTTISKWRFFLFPASDQGPAVFNGTAHVTIKAFRNDTLYVAPPHPDHWGDNTTRELAVVGGELQGTRAVFPIFLDTTGDGNGGFDAPELPNGTIIPPHTASLTMTLTWQNNATTPNPFDLRPGLMIAAANTRRPIEPSLVSSEQGKAVYTLPVDAKMVDSPYATATEWDFFVFLTSSAPTDPGPQAFGFGSIGQFDGSYTLTIVGERERV